VRIPIFLEQSVSPAPPAAPIEVRRECRRYVRNRKPLVNPATLPNYEQFKLVGYKGTIAADRRDAEIMRRYAMATYRERARNVLVSD